VSAAGAGCRTPATRFVRPACDRLEIEHLLVTADARVRAVVLPASLHKAVKQHLAHGWICFSSQEVTARAAPETLILRIPSAAW